MGGVYSFKKLDLKENESYNIKNGVSSQTGFLTGHLNGSFG